MNVFAILQESAQYTTDRNRAVYEPMGVRYAYMHGQSEARSEEGTPEKSLSELTCWQLMTWIFRLVRDNDIIIVNGYNNKVFILLFILNLFYGRAIGIDSDTPLSIPTNPFKRMVKAMYLHTIFSNRHVYGLAGGTQAHQELFRHYGMKDERVFLMPMMVDNSKFYPSHEKKKNPFVFIYVGRIIECKNLGVMLDAFVQSFDNDKNVELHVVGGGELLDDYQNNYTHIKNIHFIGKRFGKELIEAYHTAHVLILPSSSESWGLVVNEAMSAGLPVIVSNHVGAAHDLVEGHGTGFIFQYDKVDELAGYMRDLQEDEDLYQCCAEKAYQRMHDHWNYNFYKNCLKSFIDYVSQK